MKVIFEKLHAQETELPKRQDVDKLDSRLPLVVVFTSSEATVLALKRAAILASRLHARVELIVTQIVPYFLPLDLPPVDLNFCRRRLCALARETPVEPSVRLFLCRDRLATLKKVLKPHSLIVVGGRKRWWAMEEKSLARKLRRAGHDVIFTETE
jgi:hypothetical protein